MWAQRFSTLNLFLVSASKFPPISSENHILQVSFIKFGTTQNYTFPSVILVSPTHQLFESTRNYEWYIYLPFKLVLMLFVNVERDSVKFTFFHELGVRFGNVHLKSLSTMDTLLNFWKRPPVPNNLRSLPTDPPSSCLQNQVIKELRSNLDERCKIFEAFFNHINCSTFLPCFWKYTYKFSFGVPNFQPYPRIHPCVHGQTDFVLRAIFPKENIFDSKLTAFLKPLNVPTYMVLFASIDCGNLYFDISN